MMIFSGLRKYFMILLMVMSVFSGSSIHAASAASDLKKLTPDDFKRLYADSWRAVGKNIIIEGNAYLPVGSMEIFADQIIVNMESRDFEASGNVRIFRWEEGSDAASLDKIAEMERLPNVLVRGVTSSVNPLGERMYAVSYSYQSDHITADRMTGNLGTSYFSFVRPRIRYTTFSCNAESAIQTPDGVITLKDAEISACHYVESDNAHYSIAASEAKLIPHERRFYDMKYTEFDLGDRTILLFNGMVKVYGIPILWLPAFYKPKDENIGLAGSQYGRSSDLGFYVNLYKAIHFHDNPEITAKLHADFYEKRGFGYGVEGRISVKDSRTDFFVYSIYDRKPDKEDYNDFRLKVPHGRYDFRISNVTHITPRLDFRGVFEYQSDPYVRRDFFTMLYDRDPQPATYLALEQQFDRFSAAVYSRFRVNDFFTTVEKFPELRLDIPRQEIFDTGLYYQGSMSAAYMKMKWIDFDRHPSGFDELKDYSAFRFDMNHFLYYPIANRYFSFVPRAGIGFTTYSRTSKTEIGEEDLKLMFSAAEPQNHGRYKFRNYDRNGHSKVRLAIELGFELSTKIHNTWQNVRSSFFGVDGLRHIIQPYVNYTFMPKPTLNRKRIYFFDDLDRLTKQNFFRLGMINRLQTRAGNAVKDLIIMENYWDIHFEKEDGKSAFGNVGTTLTMQIFKGLSLNTNFLIDVSGDGKVQDTIRHGRNVGVTGLGFNWLNLWNINLTYSPAPDWSFTVGYNYSRPYEMRSTYSMGSTLTQINSASYFQQYSTDTDENFYLHAAMPLTPDHRTLGAFNFLYDIPAGSIDTVGFAVIRKFHCWQLIAAVGFEREYSYSKGWEWDVEYSFSANLTGLNDALNNVQNTVLTQLNEGITNIKF